MHLVSQSGWFGTFISGFCMGVADLVPGISGGTVALILGIYARLIHSLRNVRQSWRFLSVLLAGIGVAMISLSHLFRFLLGHELYRVLLFAGFTGLIVASILFCAKKIGKWGWTHVLIALTAAVFAFFLAGVEPMAEPLGSSVTLYNPRIFLCGMVAICAMLLPGISGSYVLVILGVYSHFVGAVANFSTSLVHLTFDPGAFFFLANLGSGALLGALLFSRLISWLLNHYHTSTMVALIGLMGGALRAVWPFWSDRSMPALTSGTFLGALLFLFIGFSLVFVLERGTKILLKN